MSFFLLSAFLLPALGHAVGCLDMRVDKSLGVVQAHRGLGKGPGENTLAAHKRALEIGADVLELDLQVTRDSQLVVHHDATVAEHCARKGEALPTREIAQLPLEALRGFDCGPADNTRMAPGDHGISTLHEFLEAFRGTKARFNIEMKANGKQRQQPVAFARMLLAEMRRAEVLDRVIVQSFELDYLDAVRAELTPEEKGRVQLSYLMGFGGWMSNWTKLAKEHGLTWLSPSVDKLRFGKGTVDSLHAAGVRVVPYTPDTPALWAQYLELGVDGLITNEPKALIDFLRADARYRCLTNAR